MKFNFLARDLKLSSRVQIIINLKKFKKMKKIVFSVALLAATFMVVSCDFGKKPEDPTSETEVSIDTNQVQADQPVDSTQAAQPEVTPADAKEEVKTEEATKATEKVEEVIE